MEGLDDGDVAHGEGGFAVAEVVTPLADEAGVEAELQDVVVFLLEGVAPEPERARVVGAEVFDVVELKTAGAGELLVDAVEREEERAGEDVFLDEIDAFAEFVVTVVGAGDELEGEESVGF